MNVFKRWTAAALSLALAASVSISSALALTPAEPFADFRIDAAQMEVPDRTLYIEVCQMNGDGTPLVTDSRYENCKVNQVTGDAAFYIQPNADGVWVTVDYLTQIYRAGLNLWDGGTTPAYDSLNADGELVRGGNEALLQGQTYILSAETLAQRFQETEETRAKEEGWDNYTRTFPLCRVTISRTDPADEQTYEQLYYVEIFNDIILPNDVLRDSPYCDAIEYCLVQGWFTGMEDGSFHPDSPLNRAQLAQVLWTVGGSQAAEGVEFTDVSLGDWFYQAVSWCGQNGCIAGYDDGTFLPDAPLTREQLASILYRYAKPSGGFNLYFASDLSQYEDADSVSSWAYDSMRWAMSNQLLLPYGGDLLNPNRTVTRAELAYALYAYRNTQQHLRSMW